MMIKVSLGYLDFNADIEVERQVKPFEELSKTAGDFSYQFDIELTSNNLEKLEVPFPDNVSKNVYHKIDCQLVSNDGITLHYGYLQIQRVVGRFAQCSFFSGNNNWFGLLSGPLSELDFSDFDVDQNATNIVNSWSQDSGMVFPLVDNNILMNRRSIDLRIEDFVPFIYVHTIIKRIFQRYSIKLKGELFNDPNYKRLVITKSQADQIESRTAYVGNTATQHVGLSADPLILDNDSTPPFFDGSQDNFNTSTYEYVADVKMRIAVDVSVTWVNPVVLAAHIVRIFKNGSQVIIGGFVGAGVDKTTTLSTELLLDAGDIITITAEGGSVPGTDITSATARFTPTYLYVSFGSSVIPNWTQQQFVSNIFRLFNDLSSYDPITKTLTVNTFQTIKSRDYVDISDFISSSETDYTDVVSNYGKKSTAVYEQFEFEDWADNGIKNYIPSADGALNIDNDFIEDETELIESEFTNTQAYIHPIFDMSIERLNTLDLDLIEDTSADSVSNSAGLARFSVDEDIFAVGDLVRIYNSPIASYNGDWVVATVGAGYVQFYDLVFEADSTAVLEVLKYVYTTDDNVYLMFNVPNYEVAKFSSSSFLRFNGVLYTEIALGYFNMLFMDRVVNEDFIQSLSFGEQNVQLSYQKTMLERYWRLAEQVLNDPAKQIVTCNLPHSVYINLDFLKPLHIKTLESSNLYYPAKISGYKGREFDSVIELIKLP